jgi:uncharacterized protein (TIGR03067 family)
VRHLNRWLLLLVAVLSVGLAPVPKPRAPKAPTAEQELKRLQGTWEPVSLSLDGESQELTLTATQVIKGDRLHCLRDGELTTGWKVTLDPSKRPKAMDLTAERDQRLVCVYELEGDTLTVCHGDQLTVKGRPADVKPGEGVWVEVLERVKKKP